QVLRAGGRGILREIVEGFLALVLGQVACGQANAARVSQASSGLLLFLLCRSGGGLLALGRGGQGIVKLPELMPMPPNSTRKNWQTDADHAKQNDGGSVSAAPARRAGNKPLRPRKRRLAVQEP